MRRFYDFPTVVFDCDGVIIDANRLKIDAMWSVARDVAGLNGAALDDYIQSFASGFGMGRVAHLERLSQKVKGLVDAPLVRKLNDAYSRRCRSLYIAAPLCEANIEIIRELRATRYVASGSDGDELRAVFRTRGLAELFVEILGSPMTKVEILLHYARQNPGELLMVGDATADFESAEKAGLQFLGLTAYSAQPTQLQELAEEHAFPVLETLADPALPQLSFS